MTLKSIDMKKLIQTGIFILACSWGITAQQDPMFTKYMFNSLVYNPAYAGSKGFASMGLMYRNQWIGLPGAPTTQTLTAHTPFKNDRVGVGLQLMHDKIGPSQTFQMYGSYAYRIPVGKTSRLAVGVQGGMMNWRADYTGLNLQRPADEAFLDQTPTRTLPNFGLGLYLSNQKYYVGISCPQLIEYDLRDRDVTTSQWSKQYRHYYLTAGVAIPLQGDQIVLKPSLMVKNVGLFSSLNKDANYQNIGAPTEFDADISVLFYQTLWLGTAFRSSFEAFNGKSSYDSWDVWVGYYLTNGIRIGAAYDYTLTAINQRTKGTLEFFVGYDMDFKTKKVVSVRYF
jgi:type IX secretion system PorP/SprF family membrane protein